MSARLARRTSLLAAALALGACGSVSYRVATDVDAPATVAVLPLQGPAPAGLRDAARQLLHSRLTARGYRCPELAWVDRVLSERGLLRDPDHFALDAGRHGEMLAALQVDAVLVGDDVDESSFNVFLLRRHALGGRVAIRDGKGREFWSSDHGASTFGGFLLTSGQVFAELRAQGAHGTSMASLALVDEFVEDVVGTVPQREGTPPPLPLPTVANVESFRVAADGDAVRVVVKARSAHGNSLRFDLPGIAAGVPMVAAADDASRFVGQYEIPNDRPPGRLVVRARDAFGRETTAEVAQ